jgi:hypothetical protein
VPWVRFDDQFPIHRKVGGLSDAAFRLHVEAIFWCARNLTDGFVATEDVLAMATARRPLRLVPELVARGNWVEVDGGWQIHDYLEYQPSKAKVERERKQKAERQQRWIDNKRRRTDPSADASQDVAPSPPRKRRGTGAARDSPPPTNVPPTETHSYVPSTTGACAECDMPRSNRRHQEAPP